MRFRTLGSRGPEISVIGIGGWEAGGEAWGDDRDDERAIRAFRAGFDEGITWVDTAEIYGHGRSERLIGRAVEGRPDVMVFTKVASAPRGTGHQPARVRGAARASLARLGREAIDLYQLHWPDPTVPVEETWQAMADLVDEGLVRWIGLSNFPDDLAARCEPIRHVDALQPQLSMLWQQRRSQLRWCRENGTGLIAYGPLAYGLLTGAITRETMFPSSDWRSGTQGLRAYEQLFAGERLGANLAVVERLGPVARRVGVTLAQLALAWVLHQEGVSGAIAGSRSPTHVVENARACDVELSSETLAEIETILRGRGELVA